jgi:hypothetical protein
MKFRFLMIYHPRKWQDSTEYATQYCFNVKHSHSNKNLTDFQQYNLHTNNMEISLFVHILSRKGKRMNLNVTHVIDDTFE